MDKNKYFYNTKTIDKFLKRLFPINRSLTGKGNEESLKILKEIIPIKIKKFRSNLKVYDWKIPKEWNISDAYIKDSKGERIVDFKSNNLHVIGYSKPINRANIYWSELKNNLILSKFKDRAIEYRTAYYKENWGFSVLQSQYKKLKKINGPFKVVIDSSLKNGLMSYGEYLIKGKSKKEILISTYICHPSMANDNLSGMIATSFLAKYIKNLKNRKWSYRIIFVPETIGAISYLKKNESIMKKIDTGLVLSTVGGPGLLGYKQSWDNKHPINNAVKKVLEKIDKNFKTYPFVIDGSDERQYSSQAFGINTATITKDKYYEYKQYHTSNDNLDFVKGIYIKKSLIAYSRLIDEIEDWKIYKSKITHGEVMLSKRNLFPKIGGGYLPNSKMPLYDIILWIVFLSNGKKTTKQISEKIKISHKNILKVCKMLVKQNIISEV